MLWSEVIKLVLTKEHLNLRGFLTILSYYASINRGISKKVLTFFPDIKPQDRPLFTLPEELNPQWVSGFVGGDGGFSIYVNDTIDNLKQRLSYRFYITQHSKDLELMNLFVTFFRCGFIDVRSNPNTPRCDFIVQDATSILENIIPHFDSYPLFNLKHKDFLCFKEGMFLIKSKQHLTTQGLTKIKDLSLEMNSKRLN